MNRFICYSHWRRRICSWRQRICSWRQRICSWRQRIDSWRRRTSRRYTMWQRQGWRNFSLFAETLSCLEPIFSLKSLSFLSTTLYGPEYSRERGGTEDPSRTNTNSELNKVLGRGLVGAGWVWWGTNPENLVMAESIFWRKSVRGRSGASKNSPGTANWVPKSASAGALPESSLGVVWRPRLTKGRCWTQSCPARQA